MKTLIALILFASLAYGQNGYPSPYETRYLKYQKSHAGVGGVDSSGTILNRTYGASQIDTTEAIGVSPWNNSFVTLSANDSCSIHIKYQLSNDGGATWGVLTTIDSMSTGTGAGPIVKSVSMASTVLGASNVRFIFTTTAFNRGVTTPTYTARFTVKR